MTIGEVADYLYVTELTIYQLAGAKMIADFKVDISWRFSKSDIDMRITAQCKAAPGGFRNEPMGQGSIIEDTLTINQLVRKRVPRSRDFDYPGAGAE